jgi:hypothetical protein
MTFLQAVEMSIRDSWRYIERISLVAMLDVSLADTKAFLSSLEIT